MKEMEEKIGAILNNPQAMQQIMAMAQALGGQSSEKEDPGKKPVQPQAPDLDPRLIQTFAGIMKQGNVDNDQQTLLHALCPYLSRSRIGKLERAMRAARIASAASSFLNSGGLRMLSGR